MAKLTILILTCVVQMLSVLIAANAPPSFYLSNCNNQLDGGTDYWSEVDYFNSNTEVTNDPYDDNPPDDSSVPLPATGFPHQSYQKWEGTTKFTLTKSGKSGQAQISSNGQSGAVGSHVGAVFINGVRTAECYKDNGSTLYYCYRGACQCNRIYYCLES